MRNLKVTRICSACGNSYHPDYRIKTPQKFCSRTCYATNKITRSHKNKLRIELACTICQAHFHPWAVLRTKQKYCSQKCYHTAKNLDAKQQFWNKVDKTGPVPEQNPSLGPCWLWLGRLDEKGYGTAFWEHRKTTAFRVAYEQTIGKVPTGLVLDHLCRVHSCVCPYHLEPVTSAENNMRGQSPYAINARKTHCKNGHEFTQQNTYLHKNKKNKVSRSCRICRKASTYRSQGRIEEF